MILPGVLIIVVEAICCNIFFETFCGDTNSKKKRSIIIGLSSVLAFLISFFLGSYTILKICILTMVLSLIYRSYNKQTLIKNFAVEFIFQSILLIADYIALMIYSEIGYGSVSESSFIQSIIIILSKAMLFLFVMLLRHVMDHRNLAFFDDTQWLKFLTFPLFTVIITTIIIYNIEYIIDSELELFFWVIAFGLVGMDILLFYLIRDIAAKNRMLCEREILEIQSKTQMELYEHISADANRQREISHEYKNQLECISILIESNQYQDLKSYMEEITGIVRHHIDAINSNHPIINAVLNAKYQEAMEKGIVFVLKVNDMSGITVKSQDMVVILANLLNNAIEACEKCTGSRLIKLKLVHEKDQLVIAVRNTYNGVLYDRHGVLETTKSDNRHEHGIGLKSVKQIVGENHGDYVIEYNDEEFYISILIPQKSSA